MFKRITYLVYFIKSTDQKTLQKFLEHARFVTGRSRASLLTDMTQSTLRYKTSFLDYFYFRFYQKDHAQREEYAGTGYMYEVHSLFNPKEVRDQIHKKDNFFRLYGKFVKHNFATIDDLRKDEKCAEPLLKNSSGKIVLKNSEGECGTGIEVVQSNRYTADSLVERLSETGNDLVEEFVVQHPELMALSPSGLNTVRLNTQLDINDKVIIIGATLRITVDSSVDNLAAGNIAAPIDPATGVVNGPAIYSDITKEEAEVHPITGQRITGFKLPFWDDCLNLVKEAALYNKNNRSIGWDIAITETGPDIIEANHAWCKLVWQLPGKKGLKHMIDPHKKEWSSDAQKASAKKT